MILTAYIEKLSPQMLALSPLMTLYQNGDPRFPDLVLDWLTAVEEAMGSVRLREGSEISALRGQILKSTDAMNAEKDRPPRSRITKARNVAAAEAAQRAEEIMRVCVLSAEDRLRQFEDKLCEAMTALALQVEIPPRSVPTVQWLNSVWALLCVQDATRAMSIYVASSLSVMDRLFILEAVLGRLQAPMPKPE